MPNQPRMIDAICNFCKESYIIAAREIKDGRKHCSAKCRKDASLAEAYYEESCLHCEKKFMKKKSTKHKSKAGHYFCSNNCKYSAASDPNSKYSTGIEAVDGTHNYRTKALRLQKAVCFVCGFDELKELLDVDHINGDRTNNDISNLRVLCVMCHALKTRVPFKFTEKCNKYNVSYDIMLRCKKCGCKTITSSCQSCKTLGATNSQKKTFINWPSNDDLLELLKNNPCSTVAKQLGISDIAIRHRITNRGLEMPRTKYTHKAKTE